MRHLPCCGYITIFFATSQLAVWAQHVRNGGGSQAAYGDQHQRDMAAMSCAGW